MRTAPAKLAFLAAFVLAATVIVGLGGAGRAEAHGLYHNPVKSAAPSLAAAPDSTQAMRAPFTLKAEGRTPVQARMVLQDTDRHPPASDRFDDAPCCSGAACHAGIAALSPAPSLLALKSAKLPLPSCYGSPARLPSGIERPPRQSSTI
jgi:hypothetical protein